MSKEGTGMGQHTRACKQRVPPTRNVCSGRCDGVVFVSKENTWLYFNLEIFDTVSLGLGEYADVVLGLLNIGDGLGRDLGDAVLDLRIRELESGGRPLVKLR